MSSWQSLTISDVRRGGTSKTSKPDHERHVAMTTCKVCRFFIRPGQESVWTAKPLGLSHRECVS
jgi:hypothetical protein